MSHFKVICKYCAAVIAQCRCPSPSKEIRPSTCLECQKKGKPV